MLIANVFFIISAANLISSATIETSLTDHVLARRRLVRRELPQEWSHKQIVDKVNALLKKNNPFQIVDAVFSLLGDKAAKQGAGKFDKEMCCMQKFIADQAFKTAMKDRNIDGAAAAIKFAGLERNTLGIGVKSLECTDTASMSPEIASIIHHQDAAAEGGKEINHQSTLSVAKSLKMIGADPLTAIEVGTFAPGLKTDFSFKGNTCNDDKDEKGCINTKKLLIVDATKEEIMAHVKDVKLSP